MQTSERVRFECQQILANICSDNVDLVKSKQVTNMIERLRQRLTPALCKVYAPGDEAVGMPESPGMELLGGLRKCQKQLQAVKEVVEVVNDVAKDGRTLLLKVEEAKAADPTFKPSSRLSEIALQREVDLRAKESNWDAVMAIFKHEPEAGKINLGLFDEADARTKFLERNLSRLLAEMLRQENQVEQCKLMVDCALNDSAGLSDESEIKKELALLQPLLSPNDRSIPDAVLLENSKKFETDAQLRLHKVS